MNLTKFNTKVSSDLIEGEEVLAKTKGAPKGIIDRAIFYGAGFNVGGVVGGAAMSKASDKFVKEKEDTGKKEREEAGVDLEGLSSVIVGLSNKRIILWSQNFLGAPKKQVASIAIEDVEKIEMKKDKLVMVPMPTMQIHLKDGSSFGLQIAKIQKKQADNLIELFEK